LDSKRPHATATTLFTTDAYECDTTTLPD
jgi:hypothetical protein